MRNLTYFLEVKENNDDWNTKIPKKIREFLVKNKYLILKSDWRDYNATELFSMERYKKSFIIFTPISKWVILLIMREE